MGNLQENGRKIENHPKMYGKRAMIEITRRIRKTNLWLREQIGVQDIVC